MVSVSVLAVVIWPAFACQDTKGSPSHGKEDLSVDDEGKGGRTDYYCLEGTRQSMTQYTDILFFCFGISKITQYFT
jgi:hypothetical protein